MYRALLDTCVLVPGLQRDFFLQMAAEGCFAPLWGTGVLFELSYVLQGLDEDRGIPDSEVRTARLISQMQTAFPGSTVDAPKAPVYPYLLKDPDDGHVAHAAIFGKADALVTDDRRAGFRESEALSLAGVEIVLPADFSANTAAAHPDLALKAVRVMSTRYRNPARTEVEVLEALRDRYGFQETYDILINA